MKHENSVTIESMQKQRSEMETNLVSEKNSLQNQVSCIDLLISELFFKIKLVLNCKCAKNN